MRGGADTSVAAAVPEAEVLKHRRPAKAADIDALLAVDLAMVRNPERLQNSINVGQAAAAAIIALRANDGSTSAATSYTPGTEPGDYQPTAAIVLLPGWGNVTPFAMAARNQFVGNGPHALTSPMCPRWPSRRRGSTSSRRGVHDGWQQGGRLYIGRAVLEASLLL